MPVYHCFLCDKNPRDKARYGDAGLQKGIICPVCHRPVCTNHLTTVRWRWRTPARELGAGQVCRDCKRTYRHREWDTINREWIT